MAPAGDEHEPVDDPHAALLAATRRLLHAHGAEDVRAITIELVTAMGATAATSLADPDILPFDLSFGAGDAIYPAAPPGSTARHCLELHLPAFLVDAARAVDLAAQTALIADASIDPISGLADRAMLDRALQRLRPDDTIVMIDLDRLEGVDGGTGGHDDEVVRVFGRVLRSTSRGRDVVGRYDGEEFVAVLSAGGNATAFLRRLLEEWTHHRPGAVTFSAGIARSDGDSASTLAQVNQAIALAREAGRGRWMWVPGGIVPAELGPGAAPTD